MLPDTKACITEQVLHLPPRSGWNTFQQMVVLVVITFGFDFIFEHFAFWVFIIMFSTKYKQIDPKNHDAHSLDLLVTYVTYRSLLPFIFCPIAFGLVLYQAFLFTRHWVHICTAAPCRPQIAGRVRSKLKSTLLPSILLFPLTAVWGTLCMCADVDQAWLAWKSYLNYGKGGVSAPGAFQSPAGSHRFRMHLFYCSGAAMSLSILHIPIPFIGESLALGLALPLLVFGPALICLVVPLLIASPHFNELRNIK
jgi:hypothetical protein